MQREHEAEIAEKIKKHDKMTKEFQKNFLPKLLDVYSFSDENFVVRPFISVEEMITEGLVQSICVGGEQYLSKQIEGKGVICCCRKVDAPDTPYCTIELSNDGYVVQARMRKNNTPPLEVKEFIDKWEKYFTQQKKKVEKAVKQQEVA
jgi:hypothetical protein